MTTEDLAAGQSKQVSFRSTLAGAVGFGVALGLALSVLEILNQTIGASLLSGLVRTIIYGLAGAAGGAMLGWALGGRQVLRLALAGAVGLAAGELVAGFVFSVLLTVQVGRDYLIWLPRLISGALVGLVLGLACQRRQSARWLTLAGALGFGLGFAVQLWLLPLVFTVSAPTPGNLILFSGSAALVQGAFGGAALGLAIDQLDWSAA